MAGRVRLIQNSFTSGELSPLMSGRTDVEFYFNGAETIENWIVLSQGGLKTRPGTRFIAEVGEADLTKKIRLIPFQFNDEQAYIVEAGEDYFRFFRDTAQIAAAATDAVITNGTFTTDLTGWTDRDAGTGASTWSSGTLFMDGNGFGNEARRYQEVAIGASFRNSVHVLRFQVNAASGFVNIGSSIGGTEISSTGNHTVGWHTVAFNPAGAASVFIEFTTGASAVDWQIDNVSLLDDEPVEISNNTRNIAGGNTPYLSDELFEIQFDQSADVMWMTHRAHKPHKLTRRGHQSWTFNEYVPTNDPFLNGTLFPRAVALWKSRLWFGGTDGGPNEFWATQVDDFENLDPGTSEDNEAINGVIAGGRVNVIRSMIGLDKQLFIGTYGSEMFLRGDTSGKVTPATVNNNPATEHGSASLRPIKASGYLLFLQRSQRKIRQLTYDFNTDAFIAPDLLLLADHLAEDQLVDLAYAEDPDPIVWAVSSNGTLLGATFLPTHKILGWHQHNIGLVEAVAVIPHPDGDRDQVWLVVRRTINGVVKRFIEAIEDGEGYYGRYTLDSALHYEDKRSVDLTLSAVTGTGVTVTADSGIFVAGDVGKQIWHSSGIQKGALTITAFNSATAVEGDVVVDFESTTINTDAVKDGGVGPWWIAAKTLTGLGHLAAHTVQILVDGATHTAQAVSAGGEITLDAFSAQAEVGLQYTPRLVTLRPEVQGASTIQGLASSRSDIKLRVVDTVLLSVNGQVLPDRSPADLMDVVPPPVTGDLQVPTDLDWELDGKLTVTQDVPLPATLVALVAHVHFGDE